MENKFACIILDLEPDHASIAAESYDGFAPKKIKALLKVLGKYQARLSIFAVAKTLKQEAVVKLLLKNKAEFHLHSYSHNLREPDSKKEIVMGDKLFSKIFHHHSLGYRAPRGLISNRGLRLLKTFGFKFDSSVIPSFWPIPKYFLWPNKPFFLPNGLLEIPFSTITPFRLAISLSWIRFVGWRFYKFCFRIFPSPNPLLFSFHLHDIWRLPAYHKLSLPWKILYANNAKNGTKTIEDILKYLTRGNYKLITIGQLAERLIQKKSSKPNQ